MYTILICDDDRDIVSALDIYLTSEGYQTVKAYDGQEAIRAATVEELEKTPQMNRKAAREVYEFFHSPAPASLEST